MKPTLICFVTIAAVLVLVFAGCKQAPNQVKVAEEKKVDAGDVFKAFHDNVRYPENPRGSDDWMRYRDALQQLSGYIARTEVADRIRLSSDDRKYLEAEVGLNAGELSEVEATSFRTADAHYVDECFLLRDAARKLETRGMPSKDHVLKQAHLNFRWVMRNILPHEQGDVNTPPAFTLRRGFGSALERALVFLALLRQTKTEGCLIVVPDSNPLRFLVAVHDAEAGELHLFDTRLGLAVFGKDPQRPATLKEALDDRGLLKASALGPKERLEAWLVCPLYALAPRMHELQRGLSAKDTIVLHLNARDLQQKIAKATSLPVKPWPATMQLKDPTSEALPPTVTPTRWLRAFIPKQEGGLDETGRTDKFLWSRIPMQMAMVNYAEVNLRDGLLPKSIYQTLGGITKTFFVNYELNTREMYLRGMYAPLRRRQERLDAFVRNEALTRLAHDKEFRAEVADWQSKIVDTDAKLQADPKMQGKASQALLSILLRDQFVGWLIEIGREEKLEREHQKTVLTKILALGMRDYFDQELARSQATVASENADHARAGQPETGPTKRTRETWEFAKSAWANFYLDRVALPSILESHRQLARTRLPAREFGDEVHIQISLLEKLHLDVHKYFQARLRLAEAIEMADGAKAAKESLQATKGEILALEKEAYPPGDISRIRELIRRIPPQARAYFGSRLDLLARDWAPTGNFHWLKQQIDQR